VVVGGRNTREASSSWTSWRRPTGLQLPSPHPHSPMGSWTWQLQERVAWHRADLALNGTESDGDRRAGRLELVKNRTRGTVRTPGRAASEGCLITKA
jgi:hypothetical protein